MTGSAVALSSAVTPIARCSPDGHRDWFRRWDDPVDRGMALRYTP